MTELDSIPVCLPQHPLYLTWRLILFRRLSQPSLLTSFSLPTSTDLHLDYSVGGPHLQTPETNFDGFGRKGIYLEITRWCTKLPERKNQAWKTSRDQGRPGAHRVRTPKMARHQWTLAAALLLLESGCGYHCWE